MKNRWKIDGKSRKSMENRENYEKSMKDQEKSKSFEKSRKILKKFRD